MAYVIQTKKGDASVHNGDIFKYTRKDTSIFYKYVPEERAVALLDAYKQGKLDYFCNELDDHRWLFIIDDPKNNTVIAINDVFGSNEIFFRNISGEYIISDVISNCFEPGVVPEIKIMSAYEMLAYFTITSPNTIYEGIFSVASASYLTINTQKEIYSMYRYWDVDSLFSKKNYDYNGLLKDFRDEFVRSLEIESKHNTCVSLSGGIDSGSILGILTKVAGEGQNTVTLRSNNPNTYDVRGAARSAEIFNAHRLETQTSLETLTRLPGYYANLHQPLVADRVFSYSLMMDAAKEKYGTDRMIYGYGAEMLLGNLKICKIAYKIRWLEMIVPRFIRNPLYAIVGRIMGFSKNQIVFLQSKTWSRRFLRARGPLFIHEKKMYTHISKNFEETIAKDLEEVFDNSNADLLDKLTKMYLFGWVNCLQYRDFNAMGRKFDMTCFAPFDTPRVARVMFQTPNKFRRLNKWDKGLIRDMFREFIPDELYNAENQSMIVRYDMLLQEKADELLGYLDTSPIIARIVDMKKYRNEYKTLPEPYLHMFRLIGLALWYDTHHNEDGVDVFLRAIK